MGINQEIFTGSTFCITGGTGSFGSTMVKYLLRNYPEIAEIRVFSRDENKQDNLRNELQANKVKYYIGDVRDESSVSKVTKGANYVFHAAALKQVPSCEFFPDQAVETNINGSRNVINACISHGVSNLVCLSTDKAVYPINAMGMTKALMEKTAQAPVRMNNNGKTTISITRYGNVMLSRGSVIPLFINQIKGSNSLTITDPKMTRFLMSLDESVDLVMHSFTNAEPGDLFVKKAPACDMDTLSKAVISVVGNSETKIKYIGIRHGEKIFESLLSQEEKIKSIETDDYFKVPIDSRTLDYNIYFDEGDQTELPKETEGFTSNNTKQLGVDEVVKLLNSLPDFRKLVEA